jgi:hypothetical protein
MNPYYGDRLSARVVSDRVAEAFHTYSILVVEYVLRQRIHYYRHDEARRGYLSFSHGEVLEAAPARSLERTARRPQLCQ